MQYNKSGPVARESGFSVYNPSFRISTGILLIAAAVFTFLGTAGRFDDNYDSWFKTYSDTGARTILDIRTTSNERYSEELKSDLEDSAMGLLFSSAGVALILGIMCFFQKTAHAIVYALPIAVATSAAGITMTGAIVAIMSVAHNIHVQWSWACQFVGMAFMLLTMVLLVVEKYTGTPYDEHGLKVTVRPLAAVPVNTTAAPMYASTEPAHLATVRTEKPRLDMSNAV